MESHIISKSLRIDGMTCVSCENRIEKKLQGMNGIVYARVSYSSGTCDITYDEAKLSLEEITAAIEKLDYKVITAFRSDQRAKDNRPDATRILGIAVILLALYMIMSRFGLLNIFNAFPQAEEGTGYGMLFVIGLLTSLHCVAMCGGINLSQCVGQKTMDNKDGNKLATLTPSFLYNLGRVISYTVVGFLVGAMGSVVSFSGALKGIVQLVAGVFMIIMGLNLLNLFPWLRKLNPRMPKIFARKINEQKAGKSPLIVGLLNGLMPCGPLQAMQLYALSTGSPIKGALSMLLFSLGTVPLMFGLGALSSFLSKKFTHKMMSVSAVLVIFLGISMFSSGAALSGLSLPSLAAGPESGSQNANEAVVSKDVQTVTTKLSPGSYEPITVQKGIPVRWIIQADKKALNGCNNAIVIPKFGIQKSLTVGDNVIEFTPTESGTFAYSCWMGMIRSKITVVDDINSSDDSASASRGDESDYKIPVDKVAVAKTTDDVQYVEIDLTGYRFSPAVVVVQKGVETLWNINGVYLNEDNSILLFPLYNAQISMTEGKNEIYFIPDTDFDFTTSQNTFFGYVKVVDDINNIDIDAIKDEVSRYVPTVQEFVDTSGLPSCH